MSSSYTCFVGSLSLKGTLHNVTQLLIKKLLTLHNLLFEHGDMTIYTGWAKKTGPFFESLKLPYMLT